MIRTRTGAPPVGALLLIAVVLALAAGAFAFTAGWLSPGRLTPDRFLARFRPPHGVVPGRRRNHAKGLCFSGEFVASGAGMPWSKAAVFRPGAWPVVGRFNLGDPDPAASDATVGVRGLSFQVTTPGGQQWRSALINAPAFPVATPQAFYELLGLGQSKDPKAFPDFLARHPEFAAFNALAARQVHTASYAGERYSSIDAFEFVGSDGATHAVRWLLQPAITPVAASPQELAALGPDFLFQDLRQRIARGPLRFPMTVVLAGPGDSTADPSRPWPADRRQVQVGVLSVERLQDEPDGPCRDINFDPTVLPDGIRVSDDPFLAARSAVYARSYDLRTAESSQYPHTAARGREAAP